MLNRYLKTNFFLEKYYLNYYLLNNLFYEIKRLKTLIFNFLVVINLNWFLIFFYLIYQCKNKIKLSNISLIYFLFKKPRVEYFLIYNKNYIKKFSILRSPFVYKKAWDQLEFFQRKLVFFFSVQLFAKWYFNLPIFNDPVNSLFNKKLTKKKKHFIFSLN